MAGGLGDEDVDVAVFRFTLGIPGFEDRMIPRVVGLAIGGLLLLNHVLGAQPTPEAQVWCGGRGPARARRVCAADASTACG